jgi:protein SCO1/2
MTGFAGRIWGLALCAVALSAVNIAHAQQRQVIPSRDVGLDQKLDAQVPLDLPFKDETGATVHLSDYVNSKPVILNLIFYKCPGVCTTQLDGMVEVFNKMQFTAGQEFNVVTVSINPMEGPSLAADKKESYLALYKRPEAVKGWHFLTGTQESIQALAHSIGYRYVYDLKKQQFAHPAGLVILTPKGKISKYFYNAVYVPRDLRLALIEASESRIGTPIDGVLLMCLHFDNATGKYTLVVLNVLKIAAALTLLMVGGLILALNRWERRRKLEAEAAGVLPPATGPISAAGR